MTQAYDLNEEYGDGSSVGKPDTDADTDTDADGEAVFSEDVDDILRTMANQVLWEIIWELLDPEGDLRDDVISRLIHSCRRSMQATADAAMLSLDPDTRSDVKNQLDTEIREGSKLFVQSYIGKDGYHLTTKEFRGILVERLRKRLSDVAPPEA